MNIFQNRPLALCGCLFAVFALLGYRMTAVQKRWTLLVAALAFLGILILCVVLRRVGKTRLRLLVCVGTVLISLSSSYLFFNVRYAAWQERNGVPCVAEGYVEEYVTGTSYSAIYCVRIEQIDGEKTDARVVLECGFASALQRGDYFRVRAVPRDFTDEESFDEEGYRLADGALTVLTCAASENCELIGREDTDLLLKCASWNTRLAYRLRNQIGGETGGLSAALLLGNRTWISADTKLDFQRAGISHLLALSGLHVSILIGFLEFLLRKLRLAKLFRAVLIPICAIGYLGVTGVALSTARAVLMICVLYLAFLFREEYDAFTALCTVLAVILGLTPYAVLDLSLWMSFLAAASILVFMPAVTSWLVRWRLRRKPSKLLFLLFSSFISAVAVGVVANLSLLLLSAEVFGEVSLVSVLATMLLSIPVTVLLILSAILLLLPFLPLLPWVCETVAKFILWVAEGFSEIDHVLLPVSDFTVQVWIVLLTAWLILLAVLPLKRGWWVSPIPLLLASVVISSAIATKNMEPATYSFKTGRGEVFLYTSGGYAVAVNDVGGAASAAYELKRAATAEHCTEIDDLVLSRYYNQANYFIAKVAERSRVRVVHLPMPIDEREAAIAARLAAEAELHGMRVAYDAEQILGRYDTVQKD